VFFPDDPAAIGVQAEAQAVVVDSDDWVAVVVSGVELRCHTVIVPHGVGLQVCGL